MTKDPRVITARKEVEKAYKKFTIKSNIEEQRNLNEKKHNLLNTYSDIQEEQLDDMIKKVEEADNRNKHGEGWKLINSITGRKTTKQGILKGNSKEDRVKQWYDHFQTLLGNEPQIDPASLNREIPDIIRHDLQIKDDDFTMEEFNKVKTQLKEGKSTGSDNISAEVLKRCNLDEIFLEFSNNLLKKNDKPDQWSQIDLIPLPKSGDLSDTSNYRGISLSSIVAKAVNKMILNRIQPKLDQHLIPNQNGFRPGRSTTTHILALRTLIKGVKSHNKKAIILYVDFKKAFDSVHRGKMMKILKAYSIPIQLRNAIRKLYENTKAVISPDGDTEYFDIKAGVLQGDTLAPYLFTIVLDFVLRQTYEHKEEELGFTLYRRRSTRHPSITVTDLDFADDLALISEEIYQAQMVLKRLEDEAENVRLFCNAKKTEAQIFNHSGQVEIKAKIGKILKNVENFKYLGAWTESTEKYVNVRKALAWSACHKQRKIWSSNLKRQIKIRLFVSTVESVLLYGSETWTLTNTLTKQIDGMYTRMLRMVKNISWRDHLTNNELYGNLPKISVKIRQRRMRLAGHCIRHEDEIANKLVLWQPNDGRVRRGRQKINYIDVLLQDTGVTSAAELKTIMLDRSDWRGRVQNVVRPGGRPK